MKKIVAFLLVAVMLLACMATTALAAEAGDTVTISFTTNDNPGFANFRIFVNYDASVLELVSIEAGDVTSGGILYPNGATVTYMSVTDATAQGTLFTATFKVSQNAQPGSYPVTATLDTTSVSNAAAQPVTFTINGGVVVIECEHAYGAYVQTTAPTCTDAGVETRTCSKCGATQTRPVAALGHAFGEWTQTTAPNCTDAGVETRTCANCNVTETREVAANGHSFSTEWSYDDEYHWHACANCDEVADKAAHELSWVITKNPTATATGLQHQECDCGWHGADVEIPADPSLDDVPGTGDITPLFIAAIVAVMAVAAGAVLIFKRKAA